MVKEKHKNVVTCCMSQWGGIYMCVNVRGVWLRLQEEKSRGLWESLSAAVREVRSGVSPLAGPFFKPQHFCKHREAYYSFIRGILNVRVDAHVLLIEVCGGKAHAQWSIGKQ